MPAGDVGVKQIANKCMRVAPFSKPKAIASVSLYAGFTGSSTVLVFVERTAGRV